MLHFVLYSFVGWVCETVVCSVAQRRFVNRGFLNSPICPIYGFGAFLILLVGRPLAGWPALVFLASVAVTGVLEYFTGWLLETLFQIRWWDYSHRRFNLKGRVCLTNGLLFGVMGLAAVYGLFPLVAGLLAEVPHNIRQFLASVISIGLFFDTFSTVNSLSSFSERLQRLQSVFAEMERYDKENAWFDRGDIPGSVGRLRAICAADEDNEVAALILHRLDSLSDLRGAGSRLAAAFPRMRPPKGLLTSTQHLRDLLEEGREQARQLRERSCTGRLWGTVKATAVAVLDAFRVTADIFVSRQGLYKLFWIFVIASVIGCGVETLWCLFRHGYIESRQGLIFGPFSHIYGIGAVLMVLMLNPLAEKKNPAPVFVGGALLGGTYEFVASLVQELVFGTASWDYTGSALAGPGGRTNLLYMVFWGILCTWFLRMVYPRIASAIEGLQRRPRRFFTSVVGVFLAVNMVVSAVAVLRWESRVREVPPGNAVERLLDDYFGDEFMEQVYPNMTFVK